jgi:hypothetical protein
MMSGLAVLAIAGLLSTTAMSSGAAQQSAHANVKAAASVSGYNLINVNSGKCLDVEFGGQFDFNVVDQFTCHNDPIKMWGLTNVTGNIYTLTNLNSGRCLDIEFGGQSDFNVADQYFCHGGPIQEWALNFVSADNAYTLTNINSGKCLDVGFGGQSDFNVVDQFTCHGGPIQEWRLSFVSS